MLVWIIVVSIIAFVIGMLVGEYRVMTEATQLLYESRQALVAAREHHENAKLVIKVFNETSIQGATQEN